MKKIMKGIALVSLLITVLCAGFYLRMENRLLLALTITTGTTAYHFIMRLLLGSLIDLIFRNRIDYRNPWFQVHAYEQKLYKALKIKQWKGKLPTYDPSVFNRKLHTWEEIAQATCQAELVHEVIIVFSFLPLFASLFFGEFAVFLITSLLAAWVDGVFVILQRYNRPRILQLTKRP